MSSTLEKVRIEFKNKLQRNYSLKIPDDWVSQCAEFITEEFPRKSINEYIDLVFKQLLDYDITVIGTECLPSQIFNTENGTINGVFLLQLNYCIDITQSYFSQIQKLRGIISENALVDADNVPTATQFEKKDKKNRLLTLYLTDGKNNITATENQIIPFLNDEILPGTKIEIHGKISYQNGVLFLDSENVKVLGGNVEEIGTIDNLISIIEKEIASKCENGSSSKREKIKTFDTSSNVQKLTKKQNSPPFLKTGTYENQIKNKYEKMSQCVNSSNNYSNSYNKNFKSNEPETRFEDNEHNDEDDLLMNCDLNTYETKIHNDLRYKQNIREEGPPMKRPPSMETISNYSKPSNKNITSLKKQKVQEIIEIDDVDLDDDENDFRSFKSKNFKMSSLKNPVQIDEDVELLGIDESSLKSNKQVSMSKQCFDSNNYNSNKNKENRPVKNNNNFVGNYTSSNFSNNNNNMSNQNKIDLEIDLWNLIDQSFINSCCLNKKPLNNIGFQNLSTCSHMIKGFFKQVMSPLTQVKMRWHQEIMVSDGESEMVCYIDDEPLSSLLEITCKEAKDLFKKSKETSGKEYQIMFEQKRKNCEQKLRTLNASIYFKYDFDRNKFCIFKIDNILYNRNL